MNDGSIVRAREQLVERMTAFADEEREARLARAVRASDFMRSIVDQPAVYFTTEAPLPINICTSSRTMPMLAADRSRWESHPAEYIRAWHHPDLGISRTWWVRIGEVITTEDGEYEDRQQVRGRACRFCGFVVTE